MKLKPLLPALVLAGIGEVSLSAQTTLAVGSSPGYPGTTVSVPVSFSRATNIVAAQFEIAYATNAVSSGAAVAAQASARHFVKSREVAPGVRRVVAYSLARPLSTNRATVARVPFTLADGERNSSGPLTP